MKSSVNRNLIIGFSISLLILIFSSAASLFSITNLLQSAHWVAHTNEVVKELNETLSAVKDAETGQRGFLLTRDETFLGPYKGSEALAKAHIQKIKSLTADNLSQQKRVAQLERIINSRFNSLQKIISQKRSGLPININDMYNGKRSMDSMRAYISRMLEHEEKLLEVRTATLRQFASYTPLLIAVAALIAVIITIIFYLKVRRDIDFKNRLQNELLQKDKEIQQRIGVIQHVAGKISSGDYSVRASDTDGDIGDISASLNTMADALEKSFTALEDKEWLQAGVAGLNNVMIGENDLKSLSQKVMNFIAVYCNSLAGAFYVAGNDENLRLINGYALQSNERQQIFNVGEGLPGHSAESKKMILVKGLARGKHQYQFCICTSKAN